VPTLLTETDRYFSVRPLRQVFLLVAMILAAGPVPVVGANAASHSAMWSPTVNGHAIMRRTWTGVTRPQIGGLPSAEQLSQEQAIRAVECFAPMIDPASVEQRAAKMSLTRPMKEVDAKSRDESSPPRSSSRSG